MKTHINLLLLTLFLCLFCPELKAQNLKIEGWGNNIQGKTIRFIATEDNISGLENEICRKTLSKEDSSFSFSLLIDHTCMMRLQIESFSFSFIAQKGGYYKLHILPFDFNIADSINTLFYEVPLSVTIDSSNDNNLNQTIWTIDSIADNFMSQNTKQLLFYHDKKAFASLQSMLALKEDSIAAKDKTLAQKYISDYKTYTLAGVAYCSKIQNPRNLTYSYLSSKPILYENTAYMNCFKTIYSNYFSLGNSHLSTKTLERWLTNNNYFSLIDSLGIDTLLKNEVFRELVFLQGMKECLFNSPYDALLVKNLIEKFSYQTKFPQHKTIANNLLTLYQREASSNVASPSFNLKNIKGEDISLDKYKGKPLLISFVKLNDIASLREINLMAAFADSVGNTINFLTIACDRTMDALYNFQVNTKRGASYKWDFVHFGGQWDLLEKYNVRVFPTFVLIDKDGTIIQNPMKAPSEGALIPFIPKPSNSEQ